MRAIISLTPDPHHSSTIVVINAGMMNVVDTKARRTKPFSKDGKLAVGQGYKSSPELSKYAHDPFLCGMEERPRHVYVTKGGRKVSNAGYSDDHVFFIRVSDEAVEEFTAVMRGLLPQLGIGISVKKVVLRSNGSWNRCAGK